MKQIYWNGTILTMAQPATAEAVLVENGRIAAVGGLKEVAAAAPDAERVDLKGHTMLPAFLDAHSHFTAAANAQLQVPLGECVSFEEIFQRVQNFIAEHRVPPGEWVIGQGYDHNHLEEQCHPTLALLDRAAPQNPLLLQHQSGHVGVVNSLGLKTLGITPGTKAPDGGVIGVKDGCLTGYLEENAFIHYQKQVPMPEPEAFLQAYATAQDWYLSHGICTVQEGLLAPQMVPLYQALLAGGMLRVDLVGYGEESSGDQLREVFSQYVGHYQDHFKLAGYKIFLDGSPQGRTAWMRRPYEGEEDYCGYPTLSDEQVYQAVVHAVRDNMQLLAHCNGDAAAEQFLRCVLRAEAEGMDVAKIRPVMVHAQLLGVDQMESAAEAGVWLSFFPNHVYHWGDVHIRNFGRERANHISPAASAIEKGIPFTFHQDTPVLPPDMLESVWCAVNRKTKAGACLEGEAIRVEEALAAVTIQTARQYGEEEEKGSIEPGKRADFVILAENPLAVDPMTIREIPILETICQGESLYRRDGK